MVTLLPSIQGTLITNFVIGTLVKIYYMLFLVRIDSESKLFKFGYRIFFTKINS